MDMFKQRLKTVNTSHQTDVLVAQLWSASMCAKKKLYVTIVFIIIIIIIVVVVILFCTVPFVLKSRDQTMVLKP